MTFRLESTLVVLMGLIVVSTSGCSIVLGPSIKGSGIASTETRELSSFSALHISGSGEYRINLGDEPSATVNIDDNLQPIILTSVDNQTLKIKPTENYSTRLGLQVDVTTEFLDEIHLSGSGDIQIEDINSDRLGISIAGSGDVDGNGYVDYLEISISGSGDVDLSQLRARTAKVSIAGSGDIRLDVSENLDVNIAGSGSVTYSGNPTVSQSIAGSGDIQRIQ